MTLNHSQRAALKVFRDAKLPVTHRCATNPKAPHHKTIEGLFLRYLIRGRGVGYEITAAGLAALERYGAQAAKAGSVAAR